MNLLYISFGNNAAIHLQAAFSIYSFLAQPGKVLSVNIITDNETFYKHLSGQVNIITVTQDELTEWRGEHDFFWRIKIKGIEKICRLYPNQPVMYLDTDTFLYADALKIARSLNAGVALMHENEGSLSGKKSKTEKKMWRQIAGNSFGNVMMNVTDCIWNAGVVAVPNTKNGNECELALAICDEMCSRGVTRRLIEQYSLSIALEKTYGLAEAGAAIAHYWSVKDLWNEQINNFFIEAYFAQWNFEKIIQQIQLFNANSIPVFQGKKNTNLRLKALIDKIFPNKELKYLPKT